MSTERRSDDLLRIVLIVLAVIVLFPLVMMVFAGPMMGMMGWGWGGGYMADGVSPLWGMGMMLIWLVILVGGGYLLYRAVTGASGPTRDAALDELRLAYARGDLSDEEYEERYERLRRDESEPSSEL